MDWKRITSSAISALWLVERIIGLAGLPDDFSGWRELMYHIPNEIGIAALAVFMTLMLQSHGPVLVEWVKGFREREDASESGNKVAVWLRREIRDMLNFLGFMFIRVPIMMGTVFLVGYALVNLIGWLLGLMGVEIIIPETVN